MLVTNEEETPKIVNHSLTPGKNETLNKVNFPELPFHCQEIITISKFFLLIKMREMEANMLSSYSIKKQT